MNYDDDQPEFFFNDEEKFDSRDEANFYLWCRRVRVKVLYHPQQFRVLVNGNIEKWTPDFCIPQLNVYVDIKPHDHWYELRRVKEVVWAAIESRERFWTWFIYVDKNRLPMMGELTTALDGKSEKESMQTFTRLSGRGRPLDKFLPLIS